MATRYDAIVVGARCAGAPLAADLSRRGHRVLIVDKDRFPSDTLSTHMIHPPGIAALARWGLLDQLTASGCPAVPRYSFDFGSFTIAGRPRPVEGNAVGYGPRRTVLDKLLVDAAARAGAEVREGFSVDGLLIDDGRVTGVRGRSHGGGEVLEHARVVIGADGRYSRVAETVEPAHYNDREPLECGYYTYWSNLPVAGFEIYVRPHRGWGAIPTHDGLTLVVVGWPYREFDANKRDVEAAYHRALELAPEFAGRVRSAAREAPFRGGPVSSFFRKPFGPGWALVGDAGYNKDPITAWGISDAFLDAERCGVALHQWLTGERSFDEAMSGYQQQRDQHALPMFELTCNFAALEPPPPEMAQVLGATARTQEAQDQFVSMMAGTMPVGSFFDPANVASILSGAAVRDESSTPP